MATCVLQAGAAALALSLLGASPIGRPSGGKSEIKKTYARVSEQPRDELIFPTRRACAEDLGYPPELADVPESAVESFAGVANPFSLDRQRRTR